jgi:hypothetical protein
MGVPSGNASSLSVHGAPLCRILPAHCAPCACYAFCTGSVMGKISTSERTSNTMTRLVNCKTCGKQVSQRAKVCPHCGEQRPAPASFRVVYLALILLALFALIVKFAGSDRTSTHVTCPAIDYVGLWLPPDKEFAKQKFVKKAERLHASGDCVMDGSFGRGYEKFYFTVSRTGRVQDAQVLRFSLEELDK